MYFLQKLFTICMYIAVPLLFLKLCLSTYWAFVKIPVPQGTKDAIKIRLFHMTFDWAFHLAKICEKVGICNRIQFVRFLLNATPSGTEPGLVISDSTFGHVPVRIYQPRRPSSGLRRGLVYLHGGGGIFGGKRMYDRICRYFARGSDSVVVLVDYRLGPEHQHPAQLIDCLSATVYFMEHATAYGVDANCIVLIGDSSGGTLVAAICRELQKKTHVPKIQAQILMYPFLQILNLSLPSHQQNRFGPCLTMNRIMELAFLYLNLEPSNFDDLLHNAHVPEDRAMASQKWFSADCIPEKFKARGYEPPQPFPFSKKLSEKIRMDDHTLRSPIEDEDAVVRQFPKTYIMTCEYDVFRDDGLLFKKRLEDSGVPVTWNHVQDGFHGCLMLIDMGFMECSCTKLACEDAVNFIKGL